MKKILNLENNCSIINKEYELKAKMERLERELDSLDDEDDDDYTSSYSSYGSYSLYGLTSSRDTYAEEAEKTRRTIEREAEKTRRQMAREAEKAADRRKKANAARCGKCVNFYKCSYSVQWNTDNCASFRPRG